MWWLNRFVVVLVVIGSLSAAFTRIAGQSTAKPATSPVNTDRVSDAEQLRAMQDDVTHMRALLTQMRANLGFVGGTTSPVYHEFDLEAQMWQTLINRMDRRISEMQKQNRGSK